MARRRRSSHLAWGIIRMLVLASMVATATCTGILLGLFSSMNQVLPSPDQIAGLHPSEPTRVYSSDGLLLAQVSRENREYMPIEKIPLALQQATIAIEDRRFYHHPGIDVHSMLRAATANLRRGEITQGASTITQQLARNLYLTQRRTLARKLQEIVLALQIERQYSKEEILELYLNEICYGSGAYGAEVAAETYFDRKVSELSLAECALLASIPCRPEYYDPFEAPQRTLARRNLVLERMVSRGYITQEQCDQAKREPLRLAHRRRPRGLSDYHAPYFTSYLLRQLVRQWGVDAIYNGGLRIESTLNWDVQHAAEETLREGVAAAQGLKVSEGALVAIDPRTGAIKAMVGGVDYKRSEYNCATQAKRQAGSAFKPFIYTAAIDSGYTPKSTIVDSPVSYPGGAGRRWSPQNYDRRYRGRMTLERALAHSINVVAVKLLREVGVSKVIGYAHRMGISSPLDPYLSLALGTSGVTPLEMCSAFGTLANRGLHAEPRAISRVLTPEGITEEYPSRVKRALPTSTADTVVEMLKGVVTRGTGTRARISWPCAGKTGTASDYKDAWFIGFTQDLACAVWVGNRDNTPTRRVTGGLVPARIWHNFMQQAVPMLREAKSEALERASGGKGQSREQEPATYRRTLCAQTELLAGPACPETRTVTYTEGKPPYPPRTSCQVHTTPREAPPAQPSEITVSICQDSNLLAAEHCPHVANRTYPAGQAPTKTCNQHGPPDESERGLW